MNVEKVGNVQLGNRYLVYNNIKKLFKALLHAECEIVSTQTHTHTHKEKDLSEI